MRLEILQIKTLEKIFFSFNLKTVIQDNFLKEHVTS